MSPVYGPPWTMPPDTPQFDMVLRVLRNDDGYREAMTLVRSGYVYAGDQLHKVEHRLREAVYNLTGAFDGETAAAVDAGLQEQRQDLDQLAEALAAADFLRQILTFPEQVSAARAQVEQIAATKTRNLAVLDIAGDRMVLPWVAYKSDQDLLDEIKPIIDPLIRDYQDLTFRFTGIADLRWNQPQAGSG